jgi:hypothetical protein
MSVAVPPPGQQIQYDYIVWTSSPSYYAINTAGVITVDPNAHSLLNTINTNLTSGGNVFIKGGVYDFSGQTAITRPISIRGSGRGKTILRRQAIAVTSGIQFLDYATTASGATIQGLTFQSISTPCGQYDLVINGNYNTVYDCDFRTAYWGSVESLGEENRFVNCNFIGTNISGAGVAVGVIDTRRFGFGSGMVYIEHCSFTDQAGTSMKLGGTSLVKDCYFANNNISVGNGPNIDFDTPADGTVEGCIMESGNGGGQWAIGLQNGQYVVNANSIAGFAFWGGVNAGIIGLCSGATISNNIIKNPVASAGAGAYLRGVETNFNIHGNVIGDDRAVSLLTRGVFIEDNGCNNVVVKNNVVFNASTSNVVGQASGVNLLYLDNIEASGTSTVTIGPLVNNYVSGNSATNTAANVGIFSPTGFATIYVSGSPVKLPYFGV